jgi:hypothetical protein
MSKILNVDSENEIKRRVAQWTTSLSYQQKQWLGFFIQLVHWALVFVLNVPVFFTHNANLLLLIIYLNAVVLTCWYLFGTCVLTSIENFLTQKQIHKYQNGLEVSEVATLLVRLLPIDLSKIYYITSCFPLLVITIGIWKLWNKLKMCS